VSERAFFIRNSGMLRFRPTLWGACKEFARFLLAGRIFANAPDVAALAIRFEGLRWLMPLYALFMLAGLGAVVMVLVVAGSIGKFLVLDLQYSLNERCLRCLVAISLMVAVLAFFLTRSRPWLQRFLISAPVALMCWYLFFNTTPNLLLRAVGIAVGFGFGILINRASKKRAGLALGQVESYIVGYAAGLFLVQVAAEAFGRNPSRDVRGSLGSLTVPILLALLILLLAIIATITVLDLLVIRSVRVYRRQARDLLQQGLDSPDLIPRLVTMFDGLGSHTWAQRILLDDVIATISAEPHVNEDSRLEFLLTLGRSIPPSRFHDFLYQRCEEIEGNLRRSMARPASHGDKTE
jgi:hypothetical protein